MRIQRLSWAGLRIEVGQTTLFVDGIEGAPFWNAPGAIVPLSAQTPGRHAAITHAHTDHYDPAALRRALGAQGEVLCHRANAPDVLAEGLRARPVELYEPVLLDWLSADLMAVAVPAADGWGDAQVSWIVSGGGRRVIHCGDTLWHGHWWNLARQFGPFDAAFLPINGVVYSRGRFHGSRFPATLSPEQAATAGKVLGAKVICPVHYGMVDPGHYDEVPDAATAFLAAASAESVAAKVLQPGEWLGW